MNDEQAAFENWRDGPDKEDAIQKLFVLMKQHAGAVCKQKLGTFNEDIVQEAVTSALLGLESFQEKSLFSTWFHRIILNAINLHFRENPTRKNLVSLEDLSENEMDSLAKEDRCIRVDWEGLEKTFSSEDMAFIKMQIEGYTDAEIGESLGISRGAVAQRWARLKVQLKKFLGE